MAVVKAGGSLKMRKETPVIIVPRNGIRAGGPRPKGEGREVGNSEDTMKEGRKKGGIRGSMKEGIKETMMAGRTESRNERRRREGREEGKKLAFLRLHLSLCFDGIHLQHSLENI